MPRSNTNRPHHSGGRRRPRRTRVQTDHGPKREHISELTPVDEPPAIASFEEWELGEEIQRAIKNMDITVPTPIQSLTIGAVLEGRDVIAKAETGTGKTLAFGAPLLAMMDPARATVLGLVLCPTRELAQQVASVLEALALPRGIRVALLVGGDPMHPQISSLQAGAQVVVGTPGRVLDLFQQRFLQFPWTEFAILDEADKMFEIGFLDDVRKILSYLPEERQTLLFSATFPTEVLKLARATTRDPLEVATKVGTVTADSIDQSCMLVDDEERPLVLTRLFEQSGKDDVFLVFCERRTDVDRLLRRLERLPFSVKALHGGYDQASRFRVMSAFRTGEVKALLATDVASRGLDVDHVTHVVNFSVPRELEDYAHRIGRTGRAGRAGTAITLVPTSQRRKWQALRNQAKWEITEVDPPGYSHRRRPRSDEDARSSERGAREERGGRRSRPTRERDRGEERPVRQREQARRADASGGSRDEGRSRGVEGRARDRDRPREERPARASAERGAARRGESTASTQAPTDSSAEPRSGSRGAAEERGRRRSRGPEGSSEGTRPPRERVGRERPERERPERERSSSEPKEEQGAAPFGSQLKQEEPRGRQAGTGRSGGRKREERPKTSPPSKAQPRKEKEPDGEDSFGAGL